MEKQLSQALKEIQQINEQKDRFLATLAHELRNPLQPILTSLHMYDTNRIIENKTIELIKRNVNQIKRHVDDLMDVARINKGKIKITSTVVDICQVVFLSIEQVYDLIKTKKIRLRTKIPQYPVNVVGDFTRLQQIVCNLLNNAAKYTEEHGDIWVNVEIENKFVYIIVKDSGIGISEEMQSKIFDLYTQVTSPSTNLYGGLGIGLTLVKTLVELHGGEVQVQSKIGQGSVFTVKLAASEGNPSQESVPVVENCLKNLNSDRRILVVDDNVDAALSLQMLFSMEGCNVVVAHDGEEAMKTYCDFHPDIVLLDIGLPKIDGYEVARRIRENDRQVTLIAVTGYDQSSDKKKSSEVGFDAHVVKPVEPTRFKLLVNNTFEARQRSLPPC